MALRLSPAAAIWEVLCQLETYRNNLTALLDIELKVSMVRDDLRVPSETTITSLVLTMHD